MPWKKGSVRSAFHKKSVPQSYEKRMEEKARLVRVRAKVNALREERDNKKREAA